MGTLFEIVTDTSVKTSVRVQAAAVWLRNELDGSDDDALPFIRQRIDESLGLDTASDKSATVVDKE